MSSPRMIKLTQYPDMNLSNREAQIIRLMACGYKQEDIAVELKIAFDTVRAHMKNINLRLATKNIPHAVAVSIKNGLIKI